VKEGRYPYWVYSIVKAMYRAVISFEGVAKLTTVRAYIDPPGPYMHDFNGAI